MNRLDLDPTDENIKQALLKDRLGRNKHIKAFYELLQKCNDINTIAIDGEWGSGKTFFAKELYRVINSYSDEHNADVDIERKMDITNPDESMVAVYYDAWKNDNDIDPIISILCEIYCQLDEKFNVSTDSRMKNIVSSISNLIPVYGTVISSLLKSQDNNNDDVLEKFKSSRELEKKLEECFNSLNQEHCNKLVVFIDELDRCNPMFSIKLLERIKHYLTNKNIVFVFTINSTQLQYSVKKCYGENFDGYGYLDRFFDIRLNLPMVDKDEMYKTFGIYYSNSDSVIKNVSQYYNMQIRDITHYKCLCDVITKKFDGSHKYLYPDEQSKMFLCTCIAPLIIGIFLNNKDDYNLIVSGKNENLFVNLFIDINVNDEIWSKLGLKNQEQEDKKKCAKELYEAIFGKYDNQYVDKKIGLYQFSNKTKQEINEITSLLSNISYFM